MIALICRTQKDQSICRTCVIDREDNIVPRPICSPSGWHKRENGYPGPVSDSLCLPFPRPTISHQSTLHNIEDSIRPHNCRSHLGQSTTRSCAKFMIAGDYRTTSTIGYGLRRGFFQRSHQMENAEGKVMEGER